MESKRPDVSSPVGANWVLDFANKIDSEVRGTGAIVG